MAINYYVDPDDGNDSNDGSDLHPKEHIQAAVDLITDVITDTVTIHLKSNATNKFTGDVTIQGILPVGKEAQFIIQPTIWNQTNYDEADGSPYNPVDGVGDFDITADDKPCILDLDMKVTFSGVQIRGLHFEGKLDVSGLGYARILYSRFETENSMSFAHSKGEIALENCYLFDMPIPVVAYDGGGIKLIGANYIIDPYITGVWALLDSKVVVEPWDLHPTTHYKLQIKTTSPRKADYAAIKLVGRSFMYVKDADINPWDLEIAQVEIVNDLEVLPGNYYGIVIENASILQGYGNINFKTKDQKGDYVEMPEADKIVSSSTGTITLIK